MKSFQKSNGVVKPWAHPSTKFHTSVKAALKVGICSIISDFFFFGLNPSWNPSFGVMDMSCWSSVGAAACFKMSGVDQWEVKTEFL